MFENIMISVLYSQRGMNLKTTLTITGFAHISGILI